MGSLALLNVYSYVDGYDFTGDSNDTSLQVARVALDKTNFRSRKWTELTGGLRSAAFNQAGFWQAGGEESVDQQGFNELGATNRVHTFGPDEVEGSVAYFWRGGHFQYALLDAPVGQLAPFRLTGQGTDPVGVVRGRLAAAPVDQTTGDPVVTDTTGQLGTAVELGAIGADEHLYASVHLLADVGVGDDITITIESDSANTFASPTVRATIGPLSSRGGTWLTPIAGVVADTWWRFVVDDITATDTGQFTVAAAFGIRGGMI